MAADSSAPRKLIRTLPASRRLRTGADFARTRAEGHRIVQGCLILNWRPAARVEPQPALGQALSRIGVITSRKVGQAVVRSRSRRLLREAFRQHQERLTRSVDLVLVARPSIAEKDQHSVNRDYLAALRRAGLLAGDRTLPGVPSGP